MRRNVFLILPVWLACAVKCLSNIACVVKCLSNIACEACLCGVMFVYSACVACLCGEMFI